MATMWGGATLLSISGGSPEILFTQNSSLTLGCVFRRGLAHASPLALVLLTVIFAAPSTRAQNNYEITGVRIRPGRSGTHHV